MLAGYSRPPELIGVDNPEIPIESVPDLSRHRISIATTREASEVMGAFYSAGRAPELNSALVARFDGVLDGDVEDRIGQPTGAARHPSGLSGAVHQASRGTVSVKSVGAAIGARVPS